MKTHLFALLLATACSHPIFDVRDRPSAHGVPFYPVQVVDTTTFVYEQRWFELTATAERRVPNAAETPKDESLSKGNDKEKTKAADKGKGDDKKGKAGEKEADASKDKPKKEPDTFETTITVLTDDAAYAYKLANDIASQSNAQAAGERMEAVAAARPDDKVKKLLAEPPQLPWSDIQSKATLVGVSHSRATRPGSKPSYLNATTPWGGSGSGSFELGADGTLRKLEGQQTDTLPSTISSLITGLVGTDAATTLVTAITGVSKPQAQGAAEYVSVKLTVTPVRRVYALTATMPLTETGSAPKCDFSKAPQDVSVEPDACHVALTIKIVRGSGAGDDDKKKDDAGDKLEFSGSLTLPSSKKDAE